MYVKHNVNIGGMYYSKINNCEEQGKLNVDGTKTAFFFIQDTAAQMSSKHYSFS